MRRTRIVPSYALVAAAFLAIAPATAVLAASAAGPLPLVAIHDAPKGSGSGAVSFLHPETYAVQGTVTVEGDPWPLGYDPSGASYFILGATPRSGLTGKAAGPWSLVVVDRGSSTSAVLGDLGLPPIARMFDRHGSRLYTLGRGTKGEPDVLAIVDLTEKKMLGRFKTAPGAVDWEISAGGRRLYVLHGGEQEGKKAPPSRLIGFDTETLKPISDLPLPPRAVTVLSGDEGRLLYVLCRGGKPKEGPKAQGKIVVLDASAGTVLAQLDAGFEARSLWPDAKSGLVYALGDDPAGGALTLTIVRGSEIRGRLPLPAAWGGIRLGPDGGRPYVVGPKIVLEIDPSGPSVARSWALDFDPTGVIFDAGRNRAFVTPALGLKIAELGLDDGRVHMNLTTGRTGTKVGKAIGWALLGAVERSGTASTMGPDGRFLYVINGQTDDVTIIDTTTHAVVDTIATGGGTRSIIGPSGTPSLYVESADHLSRIDATTNKLAQQIALAAEGGRGVVTIDPAGGRIFIARGTTLDVVDFATGERRASVVLPKPVSVVATPRMEERPGEAGDAPEGDAAPAPREEPAGG